MGLKEKKKKKTNSGNDPTKSNKMRERRVSKIQGLTLADCRGSTCFPPRQTQRARQQEVEGPSPSLELLLPSSARQVLRECRSSPPLREPKMPIKGSPRNQNINSFTPTALQDVLMWNTDNKNHKTTAVPSFSVTSASKFLTCGK